MGKLYNKDTKAFIGTISDEEIGFLIEELEEEHDTDADYWIHRSTLELLKEKKTQARLVSMIESAMGDAEEIEVVYTRN